MITALVLLCGARGQAGVLSGPKRSSEFAFKYEMDVNPSGQDLDWEGAANDWFAGTSGPFTIPQSYVRGVAYSTQVPVAGAPRILFRTDFLESVQRRSMRENMTIEVSLQLFGGTDDADVGGFNVSVDPGGSASAFRLNIGKDSVSLNHLGDSPKATGDNTDRMHVFRIVYHAETDQYWVWRDGRMIYGTDKRTGIRENNLSFNGLGSILIGDSSESISGEWALDYIRLYPTASFPGKRSSKSRLKVEPMKRVNEFRIDPKFEPKAVRAFNLRPGEAAEVTEEK